MAIKNIIFDYDGTCTQIPVIYKPYLEQYLVELNKRVFPPNTYSSENWTNPVSTKEWEEAQKVIRESSPRSGWTLTVTPAAPAAADPYILAFESAKFIIRNRRKGKGEADPPFEAHRDSNEAYEAPWREEAREVLEALLKKNINVYFISNSSSSKITGRLKELLHLKELPAHLKVQSDAAKFRICELPVMLPSAPGSLPAAAVSLFESLPAIHSVNADGRPVYMRRGNYFAAICSVLDNDLSRISETVFCGDIWEMDHAMPHALGGNIHLITRAEPFGNYSYELDAVTASKGRISEDLRGLLDWV